MVAPDLSDVVTKLVLTALGAALGAAYPYFIAPKREKKKQTLDLIREFVSANLHRARIDAWDFVTLNPFALVNQKGFNKLQGSREFWTVVGFYTKMNIILKADEIDKKLLSPDLSELFIWWYYASFEHQLISCTPEWHLTRNISELHSWMVENLPPSDLERWRNEGVKDRTGMIQALRSPGMIDGAADGQGAQKASYKGYYVVLKNWVTRFPGL